jgi:hypothetical protein
MTTSLRFEIGNKGTGFGINYLKFHKSQRKLQLTPLFVAIVAPNTETIFLLQLAHIWLNFLHLAQTNQLTMYYALTWRGRGPFFYMVIAHDTNIIQIRDLIYSTMSQFFFETLHLKN